MKRVLIMEDNLSLAFDWKDEFELKKFDVTLCSDADQAISHLNDSDFDIVVTDLFVPKGRGGLHVIAKLLRMGKSAPPSIAVTGASDLTHRSDDTNYFLSQAQKLGASVSVKKPVSPETLVSIAMDLCS